MTTQFTHSPSPDADPKPGARRVRGRRRPAGADRSAAGPGATRATATRAAATDATEHHDPPAAPQARILRRWSVADLIARAGGAPRAFA